ncbi:YkgJ family cysteine cluster protein [Candidatus Bathyarchaeota archaeon]|nr:YkgJ family cysteine cluster protein [Candidatus Bathyarchaeota archaeon]
MSKRYPLGSGIPCVKHRCVLCCVGTEMLLSKADINRIVKLGYDIEDFAVKTAEGWRLKNSSGKCVFLGKDGCRIYPYRPEGCRLYPLVYDENYGSIRLDDACPHADEFMITEGDIRRLIRLLARLENEKKKLYKT